MSIKISEVEEAINQIDVKIRQACDKLSSKDQSFLAETIALVSELKNKLTSTNECKTSESISKSQINRQEWTRQQLIFMRQLVCDCLIGSLLYM